MAVCIAIMESELYDAIETLGVKDFKYKFMYDSSNKDEYHEEDLELSKLTDANIFSQSIAKLKALRMKTKSNEEKASIESIVNGLFSEERQLTIVNDYYHHKNIVLVFGNHYSDLSARRNDVNISLSDSTLSKLIDHLIKEMRFREGMKIYRLDLYKSGMNIEEESYYRKFIEKQKEIISEEHNQFKEDLITHFNEAFKFRLISYYTKLREFSLEEIMDKLWQLGFLDDRFAGECYILEDEARIILAKRLCTMSFKNDIELLIKRNILKPDSIKYDIGLNLK